MIEGKKISQLVETNSLNTACCFPVLSRGATKRITFASLMNNIINNLPESGGGGGASEEEIEEIKRQLNEIRVKFMTVDETDEGFDKAIKEISFKVDGQDKTIYDYTEIVQELQAIYEQASISGGIVDSELDGNSIHPVQNKVLANIIPPQTTPENKLADKNFVNSSIATNTAYFRGTFDSIEDLYAYAGEKTNNDYAFVINDEMASFDRYKWNMEDWVFEYRLNNSSFTAEQWAAIQSGITASKITENDNQHSSMQSSINTLDLKVASAKNELELRYNRNPNAEWISIAEWTFINQSAANSKILSFDVTLQKRYSYQPPFLMTFKVFVDSDHNVWNAYCVDNNRPLSETHIDTVRFAKSDTKYYFEILLDTTSFTQENWSVSVKNNTYGYNDFPVKAIFESGYGRTHITSVRLENFLMQPTIDLTSDYQIGDIITHICNETRFNHGFNFIPVNRPGMQVYATLFKTDNSYMTGQLYCYSPNICEHYWFVKYGTTIKYDRLVTASEVQAVESKVNALSNYSTTETRIGTWIDGRPIYRKVIQGPFTTRIIIPEVATDPSTTIISCKGERVEHYSSADSDTTIYTMENLRYRFEKTTLGIYNIIISGSQAATYNYAIIEEVYDD